MAYYTRDMHRALAVVAACAIGCSALTSLDGIFDDGTGAPDDVLDGAPIFPIDDGSVPDPCGAAGQKCCKMPDCNAGLECDSVDKCSPIVCGGRGQACCGGSACNAGLDCQSDKTCGPAPMPVSCGNAGESCCTGNACVAGLVCANGSCVACGGESQPCCGDTCAGGLVCAGGNCVKCGALGQPCCIGGRCPDATGVWCSPVGCTPDCYLRCCDGTLQTVHVTTEGDCRNAYAACADHGKTLRIQWNGTYIYERATACPK
jgi:hypothetical protein